MDLSKLPRLSDTDKHVPPPPPSQTVPETGTQMFPSAAEPLRVAPASSAGPEIWINLTIGFIIQFMSGRFWSFVFSKLFGSEFTWTFSDANGPISYPQSVYFMGDLAMVLFGMVLLFEAIMFMLGHGPKLVLAAFGLTVITTLLNLIFLVKMMGQGYGLQLFSAMAVAFGGYIAMNQWRLLQSHRIVGSRA